MKPSAFVHADLSVGPETMQLFKDDKVCDFTNQTS